VFAGLVAAAPDSTKIFVTMNNPTPQLWMIDTTVKPEKAVQIQAQGMPTVANDSLYLSVQDNASQNSPSSDYYIFLASSVPNSDPSLLLVDFEPAALPGTPGSLTNAMLTAATLGSGSSQPTHVASATFINPQNPPSSPVYIGYTVDNTNLFRVEFTAECPKRVGAYWSSIPA
jgi:hypothetical protein